MFIIFKIEAVENASFLPFKSLTQITVWSDGDRQDKQFRFYDLCQNMNSSKDIRQKRLSFLGPLFEGPFPNFCDRSQGIVISNIFSLQVIKNSLPF